MVDAATRDLLPTVQGTSSAFPAKLSSAECYRTNEDNGSQRPLSPVLNSNNSHRKLIYNRKRGRSKSRVKLTKRFSNSHNTDTEGETVSGSCPAPDFISKTLTDLSNFKSNQVGDRLAKIREFETAKQKILDSLYAPKETKTYVSNRKSNTLSISDEFYFKKPVSPVSNKFKPTVDVLSQDLKAVHGFVTNHAVKQDLNNCVELNQSKMLENVNIREGHSRLEGICTGSGKNIIVPSDTLRKYIELFGDILDLNDLGENTDLLSKTEREENVCQQIKDESSLLDPAKDFQTVGKDELDNPNEVPFMQTSLSDTQLNLAADVVLSTIENEALGSPSSTSKSIDAVKLNTNIESCFDENCKTINMQLYNEKKARNASIMESCNKKRNGEGYMGDQVPNISKKKNSIINEDDDFKGFGIHEFNFAQQLHNNQSKLIKKLENLIKYYTKSHQTNMMEDSSECNGEFSSKSVEMNASSVGFSTAGGTAIKISYNSAWYKYNSVFADEASSEFLTDETLGFNRNNKAIVNNSNVINNNSGLAPLDTNCSHTNIEKGNHPTTCAAGFPTGNGKKIKLSKSALQKDETLFADEEMPSSVELEVKDFTEMTDVLNKSGGNLPNLNKVCYEDQHLKQNNSEAEHPTLFSPSYPRSVTNPDNTREKSFKNSPRMAKRRLGLSACKQIIIPNEKLQKLKAKSILEDDDNQRNASVNTPVRLKQAEIHSSTPLKEVKNLGKIIPATTLDNTDITPVKKPYCSENFAETKNLALEDGNNAAIIIRERSESDVNKRLEQFDDEYEDLQRKIKVILERKKALELQEQLIKNADDVYRRQKPGVLLVNKTASHKISLRELCGNRKPGSLSANEALDLDVPKKVLEVTSKNAKYVHFNSAWNNDGDKYYSTIGTADGAVIIPDPKDLISLAEISTAFEAMPGVDPRLLPKKWISNHFKWIVWKLASLERNFPDLFTRGLSVENVMQQLKYRYDREIDRAERPAIRKILEKDDVPQKRMVLCVSDIIEVSENVFELELTDGWYGIQTLIDPPLCKQIVGNKLAIGTKLMVQCAEILNCDGCHPLDVPSSVRLKINYNCTRRAAWFAKLGYQRTAEPFPFPLRTINSDGGVIAVVKIYIVRVYPVRYMERQAEKTVWRNKKAEDKRAQEWANARMRQVEVIHQKVQQEYEKEMNSTAQKNLLGKVDCEKLSEISSPKLLYQMLENTNDPEGFKNMMSSSQIASAMEYHSNIYVHHQKEIADRIAMQVKNLKSSHREVTSILKLRIVDGSESSKDSFIFNIWKPTEDHLQLLKEGSSFSVYNVFPKPNGDLTANSRTHFKPELPLLSNKQLQRCILPISRIQNSLHKPLFNEYDTVGTVVQMQKDANHQDLWLTDSGGRLLYVKIVNGPDQCSLLDNLNRGQGIAAMNLIFCHPHDMFGRAQANQCTVITGYPQHKFLQTGLADHFNQLPKDLTPLLSECDKKIEVSKMHVTRNTSSSFRSISTSGNVADLFDDSSEDNTLISSRLTTTDVAMSLIDTDQFL